MAKNIRTIRPDHTQEGGLLICDESEQKLGFYGAEPTPQRANEQQARLTDNATFAQVVSLVNELRDALVEKGIIKGSE